MKKELIKRYLEKRINTNKILKESVTGKNSVNKYNNIITELKNILDLFN